jgi:hypothetical protein
MNYESEDEESEEEEVYTPLHSIRLLVASWNLGGKPCDTAPLDDWIPPQGEGFDLIAVGTQENKTAMYEMMGASHPFDKKVADHLGKLFTLVGFHTMRDATGLFGIRLCVFIRKEHAKRVSGVEKSSQATGLGHVMGNKGGVMVKIELDGTSICFVTCHLAARDGDAHQLRREQDAGSILCGCRLGNKVLDAGHQFHHCFWFGDLNTRLRPSMQTGVRAAGSTRMGATIHAGEGAIQGIARAGSSKKVLEPGHMRILNQIAAATESEAAAVSGLLGEQAPRSEQPLTSCFHYATTVILATQTIGLGCHSGGR